MYTPSTRKEALSDIRTFTEKALSAERASDKAYKERNNTQGALRLMEAIQCRAYVQRCKDVLASIPT